MKIEYVRLSGPATDPDERVMDTITWDELDAPSYTTGASRALVEIRVAQLGAERARKLLAEGWSNGYVLTRTAAVPSETPEIKE